MSLKTDLLDAEREMWLGGPDAFRAHLDETCLIAFSERMAGAAPKEEIARQAQEGRWTGLDIEPKGITELSDQAAVVTYEARATRADGERYHALVSSAYVHRPDGWKLAFHQQAPLD